MRRKVRRLLRSDVSLRFEVARIDGNNHILRPLSHDVDEHTDEAMGEGISKTGDSAILPVNGEQA